ncbi:MAG: sulfotransferase domain-containing protein, partial [Geminicoccaceae bacterium]
MLIKEAFGKFTYSEYNDRTDIGGNKALARQVAHVSYPMNWDDFYALASAKPKACFVKTHHPPKDDAPAIYVLRDGQAATVSYFHYLNNFGTRAFALRDVVLGSVAFGSWSQHVEA